MNKHLLSFLLLAFTVGVQAQPGELDLTFSSDGKTTLDFGSNTDEAFDVAVQPDGKILVAGNCNINFTTYFAVVRYNIDGTLDNTFNSDGKVETLFGNNQANYARCMVLQPDGKIVVAGTTLGNNGYEFAIARYKTNGTLDSTFSGDGLFTNIYGDGDFFYGITLQSDGKIVAAGSSGVANIAHVSVLRLNDNGTLDNTFSNDGRQSTVVGDESEVRDVLVQSDGKITVVGRTLNGIYNDILVARYTATGILDVSFDTDGICTLSLDPYDDFANSVLQLSSGKLLVGGTSNIEFALMRFNANGSLDNTFSSDGVVTADMNSSFDEIRDIAIDANGMIVAAGTSNYNIYDVAVLRFQSNGTLDNLFSLDGKTSTDIAGNYDYGNAVAIQADGKIVVAGSTDASSSDFILLRYQGICPTVSKSQSLSICNGESITVGNNTHTAAGSYTDNVTLPSGCDSIVYTTLTVLQPSTYTQTLTINSGQSITVGNNTYAFGGTYTDILTGANGCDSVVTTNLTVLTGVEEVANINLRLWPMPFNNELFVQGTTEFDKITLLDVTGKEVLNTTAQQHTTRLATNHLLPGVYILQHKSANRTTVLKVVKNER